MQVCPTVISIPPVPLGIDAVIKIIFVDSEFGFACASGALLGIQVRNASGLVVNIPVVVAEVRWSSICPWTWVLVFYCPVLEENHSMLLVEDSLAEAVGFGERVPSLVT